MLSSGTLPISRARRRSAATAAALLAAAGFAMLWPSASRAEPPEGAPNATEILRRAFQQRYEIDVTSETELKTQRDGGEEHTRVLRTALSGRGGDFRAIGQVVSPPNLQGMTILSVEEGDSRQTVVYLPELDRVRRISVAQENDRFLGTDVTYEDFTRRRVSDCAEIAIEREVVVEDERAHAIACRPREEKSYARAVFVVAESDGAILEMSQYESDGGKLLRRISSPREHTVSIDGHPLPTRMHVETPARGTATEVTIRHLRAAKLPDKIFSASLLQHRRPDLSRLVE